MQAVVSAQYEYDCLNENNKVQTVRDDARLLGRIRMQFEVPAKTTSARFDGSSACH
jgi:hypothetical protein